MNIFGGYNFKSDSLILEIFYKDLSIRKPDFFLNAAANSASETIGQILIKIEKILSDQELNSVINKIILPSFMAIENNWNNVDTVDGPVQLVDIKFELGIKSIDNSIVLSDVVDNDSWRIWPGGNPAKQLDKQSFREGEDLIRVANKYELVTKLTSQFKGVN